MKTGSGPSSNVSATPRSAATVVRGETARSAADRASRFTRHLAQRLEDVGAKALVGQLPRLDRRRPGRRARTPELLVRDQAPDRIGKRAGVSRRHEHAGVADELERAAVRRRDGRDADAHVLEDRERARLRVDARRHADAPRAHARARTSSTWPRKRTLPARSGSLARARKRSA